VAIENVEKKGKKIGVGTTYSRGGGTDKETKGFREWRLTGTASGDAITDRKERI